MSERSKSRKAREVTERKRRIGFVGLPPEEALAPRRSETLIDLDNFIEGVTLRSEAALPRTTCRIIRRVYDNALSLDLDEIVIDEGYGKCDAARGLAELLAETLSIPVIRTQNDNRVGAGTPICDSELPLRRKVELILEGIVGARQAVPQVANLRYRAVPQVANLRYRVVPQVANLRYRAAFWGVPAADFSIYELFPEGTQVLGWTRCLENRTPAEWELEMWVPEGVPTVFFAQTFCAKTIVAQRLARKHDGLFVDVDGVLPQPVRAKIEAFLRFRSRGPTGPRPLRGVQP
jgi:hypothetical protein